MDEDNYICGFDILFVTRDHHTWLKQGDMTSLWLYFNVYFPATACPPTFHTTNVLHNHFKKDAINKFGIKYYNKYQTLHRSHFRNKGAPIMWILKKKYDYGLKNTDFQRLIGWLKLCLMAGIGRIHWNQGKKVTHFAWFGEPWVIIN